MFKVSETTIKHSKDKQLTRISPVDNIMLFLGLLGGRLLAGGNISTPSLLAPFVLVSFVMGTMSSAYADARVSIV